MAQDYDSNVPNLDNNFRDDVDQMADNFAALRSCFSGETAPTVPAPVEGQLWWKPSTEEMSVYDGAAWILVPGGLVTFLALGQTPADYTGFGGYFVKVNDAETALIFAAGLGKRFKDLLDTPADYTDQAGNTYIVNPDETALISVQKDGTNRIFLGEYEPQDTGDPGTQNWVELTRNPAYQNNCWMFRHPDDTGLLCWGGVDSAGTYVYGMYEYDITAGTWSKPFSSFQINNLRPNYGDVARVGRHIISVSYTSYGFGRYNIDTNSFDAGGSWPFYNLHNLGMAEIDDKTLLLFGGQYTTPGIFSYDRRISNVGSYDVTTNTITNTTSLPKSWAAMASCGSGRFAYGFGGIYNEQYSNIAWKYDYDGGVWIRLASLPSAPILYASATPISDTQIVIAGGTINGGFPSDTVFLYDIVADEYYNLPPLDVGGYGNVAYVPGEGKIYAQGGQYNGQKGRLWKYNLGGSGIKIDLEAGEGLIIESLGSEPGAGVYNADGDYYQGGLPFAPVAGTYNVKLIDTSNLYKIKRYDQ